MKKPLSLVLLSLSVLSCGADPPAVSERSSKLSYDLSQPALPAGLVATRTGCTIYAQRSASTVVPVTGPAVYEDRGDGTGGGFWVLPGWQNFVSDKAFDFSTGWDNNGTSPIVSADDGLAPDGTLTADKVVDSSTSSAPEFRYNGTDYTSDVTNASLWIQDATPAPGSQSTLSPRPDKAAAVYTGSGTAWRRVHSGYQHSGNIAPNLDLILGATISNGVEFPVASSTGSVRLWGAQATHLLFDGPLCDGSTSSILLDVGPADLGSVLAPNGDFHVVGSFITPEVPAVQSAPNAQDAWSMFEMETPQGRYGLTYGGVSVIRPYFAGTMLGSLNIGYLPPSSEIRYEMWNRQSDNKAGVQVEIMGCRTASAVYHTTAHPISAPTAFHLQHNSGSNILGRRVSSLSFAARDENAADGLIFGDSIVSAYSGNLPAVGNLVYTFAEAHAGQHIVSYAVPGERVEDQRGRYDGSPQKGRGDVRWVFVQIGVNNLDTTDTAAVFLPKLQAFVDDIGAWNPNAKILLSQITPCRAAVGETAWAQILIANEAIAGNGSTPITGPNIVRVGDWSGMADANGNLAAAMDSGDGLHDNAVGRQYQASRLHSVLAANDLLVPQAPAPDAGVPDSGTMPDAMSSPDAGAADAAPSPADAAQTCSTTITTDDAGHTTVDTTCTHFTVDVGCSASVGGNEVSSSAEAVGVPLMLLLLFIAFRLKKRGHAETRRGMVYPWP